LLCYLILTILTKSVFNSGPLLGPVMCGAGDCELPNCRCVGVGTPGSIWQEETPQLVVLSMEGTVDINNGEAFKQILQNKINPDGCPISGTWFVYDHNTDYQVANSLYSQGVELGVMPILQESESFWDNAHYGDWEQGIKGAKSALAYLGNIPEPSIRGVRAHSLAIGGNHQFQAMQDSKVSSSDDFLYDASWKTGLRESPSWPFTMDYFPDEENMKGHAPYDSYPGLWEFPLYPYTTLDGRHCTMLSECATIKGSEPFKNLLLRNFFRHYQGSKAPFTVHMDNSFLDITNPYNANEVIDFLVDILSYDDVYVLNMKDVLEWIRHPTNKTSLESFPYWSCGAAPEERPCQKPTCCSYNSDDECLNGECEEPSTRFEKKFNYCVQCPQMIPIWGNPYGLRENHVLCRNKNELSSSSSSNIFLK